MQHLQVLELNALWDPDWTEPRSILTEFVSSLESLAELQFSAQEIPEANSPECSSMILRKVPKLRCLVWEEKRFPASEGMMTYCRADGRRAPRYRKVKPMAAPFFYTIDIESFFAQATVLVYLGIAERPSVLVSSPDSGWQLGSLFPC
jgi:hypothetical protein